MSQAEPRFDSPGRGRIYDSIIETIGNTPLVRTPRLSAETGLAADLVLKLEFFNPLGSVKDRIGVAMIDAAEHRGEIEPGRTTIVESTSGNTGIALAFVCAARGYELVLTMPQGMSREREKLVRLYGADVRLVESLGGMSEARDEARRLEPLVDELAQHREQERHQQGSRAAFPRDVAEREQSEPGVVGDRLLLLQGADHDLRLERSALVDRRHQLPADARARIFEVLLELEDVARQHADAGVEHDAGKSCGLRLAHEVERRGDATFGGDEIGPTLEELERKSDRDRSRERRKERSAAAQSQSNSY